MIRLRRFARDAIEKSLDVLILRGDVHACIDYRDFQRHNLPVSVIYDVGANVGQTAQKFLRAYPNCRIHCFEPVSSAFGELARRFGPDKRVVLHNFALGKKTGAGEIFVRGPTTHSFVHSGDSRGTESVNVKTLDDVIRENGTSRIDLLKIDVEGFELSVLEGGCGAFEAGLISMALIEVGFDPRGEHHTLFDHVRKFMFARGFQLFGFYNQSLEYTGELKLRFADACFVLDRRSRATPVT